MVLNKQKGNMYGFVTHTWNPIKGVCPHDCGYCYMKRFPQKELRLDEKCTHDNLGEGNFIFVGSSTDMWADEVPEQWINFVLDYCMSLYSKNTYLFQTKNPKRFTEFREKLELLRPNVILATTMETNREGFNYNAPTIKERSDAMTIEGFRKMITIEPIIDFDVIEFAEIIKKTNPEFVNIGADSKKSDLPEPSAFKINNLIEELKKFTKINSKKNLDRITS